METGSELVLRPDGLFDWSLSGHIEQLLERRQAKANPVPADRVRDGINDLKRETLSVVECLGGIAIVAIVYSRVQESFEQISARTLARHLSGTHTAHNGCQILGKISETAYRQL